MGHLTPAPKIVCGIVCGMVSEVRALGRWANDPRIGLGISGARPGRAEAGARPQVAAGSPGPPAGRLGGGAGPGAGAGRFGVLGGDRG